MGMSICSQDVSGWVPFTNYSNGATEWTYSTGKNHKVSDKDPKLPAKKVYASICQTDKHFDLV
jgi:hypothetical protein